MEMTREKLKELNILAERIEYIKSNLEDIAYIKEQDDIKITAKDGRKIVEHWVDVRIPRNLKAMICNEIQNKLESMLVEAEKEFEKA